MAEGPNFSSAPVSRYQITTPSPRFVRGMTAMQSRQRRLQEAASLLPDSEYLSEVLLKHDLSPADRMMNTSKLNNALDTYLSKYNENPYYAFSREGVEGVKSLKRMVNSPEMLSASQAFKEDTAVKKRIDDTGLSKYYNVNSAGEIQVMDKETKQLSFVTPDKLATGKYELGTLEDYYQKRAQQYGYYTSSGVAAPNSFEMEDPSKIYTMIESYFTNIGSEKREQMGEFLSITTKDDSKALQYKMNAILGEMGLSQAAKNTLYSDFYRKSIAEGKIPNPVEAENAFKQHVLGIAQGKHETEVNYSESPQLKAQATAGAIKGATEMGINEYLALHGKIHQYKISDGLVDKSIGVQGLDKAVLNQSIRSYKDKNGVMRPSMNLASSNVTRFSTGDTIYIADLKDGDGSFVPLGSDKTAALEAMVLDKNVFLSTVGTRSEDGRIRLLAPGEEAQEGDELQIMMKAYLRPGIGYAKQEETEALLNSLGYVPQLANDQGLSIEDYSENLGDVDNNVNWAVDAFENDLYALQILVPTNPSLLRAMENKAAGFENKQVYQESGASETIHFDSNANTPMNAYVKQKAAGKFTSLNELK